MYHLGYMYPSLGTPVLGHVQRESVLDLRLQIYHIPVTVCAEINSNAD